MRYLTFAGAFVVYYVGLLVSGAAAFVILALLVRWVCPCRNCRVRRGRSTPPSNRPHRGGDTRLQARVGRPHDELDELLHNLADEGGEILIMERMNERSW